MDDLVFPGRKTIDKAELFRICNYAPHAGQQAVHDAGPQEYPGGFRHRVVACGVRWGKSWAAAHEMVAMAIAPNDYDGWTGWVVAPFHNLASIVFDNVCAIFAQHLPHLVIKSQTHEGSIVVRNLAGREVRILRKSSERGLVSLTGASVDFMVIDEASAVPDVIWESALSTRLVDRHGATLSISTPRGTGGWWPDLLRKGLAGTDDDVWAIRTPSWVNPRLDRRELLKMRMKMRPDRFAQEIEARLVEGTGAVFDAEAIRRQATAKPRGPEPGAVYYAGLDLAASRDFNVLTIVKREDDGSATTVHVDRWHKLDVQASVSRIARTCRRYDCMMKADATGLGAPIVDLIRAADVSVEAVILTQQRKAELISNLGVLLEKGRLTLLAPDYCPEMVTELTQYAFTSEDNTKSMSAPEGAHDDTVISAALAAAFFRADNLVGRVHRVGLDRVERVEAEDDAETENVEPEFDDGPRLHVSGDAVPTSVNRRRSLRSPFNLRIRF